MVYTSLIKCKIQTPTIYAIQFNGGSSSGMRDKILDLQQKSGHLKKP